MAKKFSVGHANGESMIVEARSMADAAKKSGWAKEEIVSIAIVKPAPTQMCSLKSYVANVGAGGPEYAKHVKVAFPGGAEMVGSIEAVNAIFALMHYGEIAVKKNMMSGKPYIEAVGTPNYCSPSSEAYWSI